jgi:hypothetical protein
MQGIEQLGYEVVEEPMVPEGGVQQFKQAADMLAEFGRHGDTYIVHAAEGETVVPMEVLEANPRLKQMLYQQLEEMGVDPQRYVVGNELNSINPVTGRPEFFFKKIFKAVKKVVKKVVNVVKKVAPIVLPIVAPFLLPAMPLAFASGLGSLAGGLIAGQDFKTALKGAVITGGIAGLGNMMAGGSFMGSKINPTGGFGDVGLRDAFTLDNPFTKAMPSNLQAIADTAAPRGETILEKMGIGGGETATTGADGTVTMSSQGQAAPSEGFFSDVKRAVVPGDNYGFGDLYSDYISPSRASIQPNMAELSAKGATAGAEAVARTNAALTAAGQAPLTEAASSAIINRSIESAAANAAPGFFTKYGPLAATALGGAAVSDAVFGTNLITPPEEQPIDMPPTGDELLAQDPAKYGFDFARYVGDNPYYQRQADAQPSGGAQAAASNAYANPYLAALLQGTQTTPVQSGTIQSSPMGAYGQNTQFARTLFAAQGGEIVGPGTPTSDSIPAMLSDGEFVMNARAVRGAGGGDRRAGAQRMYQLMRQFERRA